MLKDHTLTRPGTGEKISLPTHEIVIDGNICERAADDLARLDAGRRLLLVADNNTYEALGRKLHAALERKFNMEKAVFPESPEPDSRSVTIVREAAAQADVLIAVGGGTINDICKRAAFLEKKPYAAYATALSMNGYTSGNASILVDGYRQSMPAQPPLAIYVDLNTAACAPVRLTLAGLGDSLARATAQVDWQLSHRLLGTAYDSLPFDALMECEKDLFECCDGLAAGDTQALTLLAKLLMWSGIGMWIAKGSYPASQGEHMIAHTMELIHPSLCKNLLHGEMIGVTTLTMAALQEKLLDSPPILRASEDTPQVIHGYFGTCRGEFLQDYEKKKSALPDVETLNTRIAEAWPELQSFAEKCGMSHRRLENALKRSGAPTIPKTLEWPETHYQEAVRHARFTRNRFTFLDIAG